jgi:hypothetical protein
MISRLHARRIWAGVLSVFIFAYIVLPSVIGAQSNNPPPIITGDGSTSTSTNPSADLTIHNPISATSINGFIKDVLIGLIKIGIPIIAIAIIYSGYMFVTAQGKPGDIEKAKSAFMYTLIGGAILLGAWAIAQLISDTVLSL